MKALTFHGKQLERNCLTGHSILILVLKLSVKVISSESGLKLSNLNFIKQGGQKT